MLCSSVYSSYELSNKYEDIQKKNLELLSKNQQFNLLKQKLKEISLLEKIIDKNYEKSIVAKVVGYQPYEQIITLPVGRKKGVSEGNPVVNADGLVGVVSTVSDNYSQVLLINSPRIKIGAMIKRDMPIAGILTSESPGCLVLEYQNDLAPLKVDDLVVTSGYSEKIPKDIPIGKVYDIEIDTEFGSRKTKVFPFLKLGKFQYVGVLK